MSNSSPVVNNLFSTVFSKSLIFKLLLFFLRAVSQRREARRFGYTCQLIQKETDLLDSTTQGFLQEIFIAL